MAHMKARHFMFPGLNEKNQNYFKHFNLWLLLLLLLLFDWVADKICDGRMLVSLTLCCRERNLRSEGRVDWYLETVLQVGVQLDGPVKDTRKVTLETGEERKAWHSKTWKFCPFAKTNNVNRDFWWIPGIRIQLQVIANSFMSIYFSSKLGHFWVWKGYC